MVYEQTVVDGYARRQREVVDFAHVPPKHQAIHDRLENWARWCAGRGGCSNVQPMFRLYRPTKLWGGATCTPVIDAMDAVRIQKAVSALPEPHRLAVAWFYNQGTQPMQMARRLAVSMLGLNQLLNDGRLMLINRKA